MRGTIGQVSQDAGFQQQMEMDNTSWPDTLDK